MQAIRATWSQLALEVFEREEFLAGHVSDEFARLRRMLLDAGLSEETLNEIAPELARLIMEPMLLVHRAAQATSAQPKVPVGLQSGRTSFAEVNWTPFQVHSLRPDLNLFQARVFLEYRELELSSAMRQAGWAKLRELLAKFAWSGGA
jgi:hypothetical protein